MGAALGTVGGACDIIVDLCPIKEKELKKRGGGGGGGGGGKGKELVDRDLDRRVREIAQEQGEELARDRVKGIATAIVACYDMVLLL